MLAQSLEGGTDSGVAKRNPLSKNCYVRLYVVIVNNLRFTMIDLTRLL